MREEAYLDSSQSQHDSLANISSTAGLRRSLQVQVSHWGLEWCFLLWGMEGRCCASGGASYWRRERFLIRYPCWQLFQRGINYTTANSSLVKTPLSSMSLSWGWFCWYFGGGLCPISFFLLLLVLSSFILWGFFSWVTWSSGSCPLWQSNRFQQPEVYVFLWALAELLPKLLARTNLHFIALQASFLHLSSRTWDHGQRDILSIFSPFPSYANC